ncbi:MAG: hypothetical protein ACYC2O_00590 [Microthrixaceae bacterium]
MARSAPKAWYPDPTGRHQLRWWTGRTWAAAVVDDGCQTFDPEGLTDPSAPPPRAEPGDDGFAEVLAAVGAGSLPGEDACTAPVLSIWQRRRGAADLDPTWSVHDGRGRWLGTFRSSVSGAGLNDQGVVLTRPDGPPLRMTPRRPDAVAVLTEQDGTGSGRELGIVRAESDEQHLAAWIDGMHLARAVRSAGTVEVVDLSGLPFARLVPPPLALRERLGKRCGWDPVLVAEQHGAADPLTARAGNLFALGWEHVLTMRLPEPGS